jgi:hypothetical protein
MMNYSTLRVGVLYWEKGDGIASRIANTLQDVGCGETVRFFHEERLPKDLDIVLAHGPLGSMVPLANQLLSYPPSQRPALALWMTEQLPAYELPEWLRYTVGAIRSRAERLAFHKNAQGEWQLNPYLRLLTMKMFRFRYYGDLFWLSRDGVLSVLATTSKWIAEFLKARGFDPVVAYIGFHPDWGENLELERDIPVLWLARIRTNRQRRILNRIRADLRARGVEILVIDGIENPPVFGEERKVILNRTKVVLNILRKKSDNNAVRFCLAAPNHALVVTEPTLPHTPFKPGVHLVEAEIERMADTICYYLTHEEERKRITEQACQFVTTELTMRKGVVRILEKAVAVRGNQKQ